jgi:prophage regulatory protein
MEAYMSDIIHRLRSTLYITGLSRSAMYDALSKKAFPEPVMLGKRAVGWRESDLMAWVASRKTRNATK